ncbi:hypothetical protein [Hyphomicrobium sp. 802]|uniref:hypothetical protein n=1 Tax=Hyphomicrobium sp. 802 TaxID=1112272 RepID=UPI00045E5A43|nr:hypothetical protein [Hyphomicrobium sp. 802]
MTDEEILVAAKQLRAVAAPVGPAHGLWDLIFDAEAIARGEQSLLPRHVVEPMLQRELEKLNEVRR